MPQILLITSIAGMVIEAVGIVIFTKDVLDTNNSNIQRTNKYLDVDFTARGIVISDNSDDTPGNCPGGSLRIEGAVLRESGHEKLQQIEIIKRRALFWGAALVGVGFSIQLLAQVVGLF